MKRALLLLLPALLALPLLAISEEEKKDGILPKVDKPIPDTYEPLDGADWNHRTSDEIKALREYQKQQKEKERSEQEQQLRKELESKIQAPDPGAAPPPSDPEIEEDGDSLRISDPD